MDFSGAEIEGCGKDGVLEAFIDGDRSAETRDLLKAVETITPTAQMMSERSKRFANGRGIISKDLPQDRQLSKREAEATGSMNF